jgi:hypothetical protein
MHPYLPKLYILIYRNCTSLFTEVVHSYLPIIVHCYLPITTAYFIYFGEGKTRLELMNKPNIAPSIGQRGFTKGIAHFTISVGGKEKVNELTETLRSDGYTIFSEARTTGDGYYESVVLV